MSDTAPDMTEPELSILIPSYNSAPWLPSTFDALAEALRRADARVQVVLVDDGSTDATLEVIDGLRASFPTDIEVVVQKNMGRYAARLSGLAVARSERVLLLDSRVLIQPDALRYALERMRDPDAPPVWNAHAITDPSAPLVGLFWDVPTYVFWGRYLRSPRPYDLTGENFDSAPKGTTMFLAPRQLLLDAFEVARPTTDSKLVSDDTKLLRYVADAAGIRIDPGFSAVYRPRTRVREFLSHAYHRGTVFVDSYARTSRARSSILLALAAAPLVAVAALVWLILAGRVRTALSLVAVLILLVASLVVPAAVNRCPPRSIAAYLTYVLMFVVPFWRGIVRGVFVHRRALFARSTQAPAGATRP